MMFNLPSRVLSVDAAVFAVGEELDDIMPVLAKREELVGAESIIT